MKKIKAVNVSPFSPAIYLAKDTIGFFRGAEFGDEMATIKQMENDTFLSFQSANLLQYEYKSTAERRYTLEYTFKNDQLSNFTLDVYLANSSEADNLTSDLKEWFRKKYGPELNEMGSFVWKINAPNYKEAYIDLKDESAEFGYGKVNISAYAIR